MKFIFWENIVSHLRVPFYKELAKHGEVILVVDKELTEDRKKLGWEAKKIEQVNIIVNPSNNTINDLVKTNKDAYHFVAGINVYEAPTKAQKVLIKENIKFSVLSEQFKKQGFKGFLRRIKSKKEYFKYNKNIDAIYAIGDDAVSWYAKSGYDRKKIHQWIYFSEFFEINRQKTEKKIVLFVGALSDRKNILFLVESFLKIRSKKSVLRIIGGGEHQDKIIEYSKKNPNKIEYLGVLPTLEARKEMAKSTILVLPSIFDGWGAVVNEALLCGNYCITSNNCGSKTLFRNNKMLGTTFDLNIKEDLMNVLEDKLENADEIDAVAIKNWANDSLDHTKAIQYFLETIKYNQNHNLKKPKAAWL